MQLYMMFTTFLKNNFFKNKNFLKDQKFFISLLGILCIITHSALAQAYFLPLQESQSLSTEYVLAVEPMVESYSYDLTLSEYYGALLLDNVSRSSRNLLYRWSPPPSLLLFPGTRYLVTVSYYSEALELLETKASEVFIDPVIQNRQAPPLFFLGNSVDFDSRLQPPEQINSIIDAVVFASKNTYPSSSILLRGHASFVSDSLEERKREQVALLELSQQRALRIFEFLRRAGINTTRINIESVGGSEQLSEIQNEKWKNRRVEIIFLRNSTVSSNVSDGITNDAPPIPASQNPGFSKQQERTSFFYQQNNSTEPPSLSLQRIPPENTSQEVTRTEFPSTTFTGDTYFDTVQPWPDMPIVSKGVLTLEEISSFIRFNVPTLKKTYTDRIISIYLQESNREQINSDIVVAQMLLETDFLRFLGDIDREQYTFARIEGIDRQETATFFRTETIGIRAHIQQLKGLATSDILRGELVDHTYTYLDNVGLLGSAPTVKSLTGRWSSNPEYGNIILRILRKMFDFANAR